MSYVFVSYSGGFIYWVAVKFCKTKLNDELDINKKRKEYFYFYNKRSGNRIYNY